MYFDTHAHYDDRTFDEDRDSLLAALPGSGVTLVIDPGCDVKSSRAAIELAARYEHVYAAVGIHPEELGDFTEENLNEIARLAGESKCAAIGEIGLDYYWDDTHKAEQKELFRRQIELAIELSKPVIVHDREAHGDSLEIVSRYPELRGAFHCFSGSAEMAKELLRRGGGLNRQILSELLALAGTLAQARGKQASCSVNVPQAVIQLQFSDAPEPDITIQQANEGEAAPETQTVSE